MFFQPGDERGSEFGVQVALYKKTVLNASTIFKRAQNN
jgi:hypothetical protein